MHETTSPLAAPVAQSDRIQIIDSIRGIAILGILLMNIPGFSLPGAVSWDPSLRNETGTFNFTLWHFIEWFPEGTQRALFSMLFGAGIILFTEKLEKRLNGTLPLDYFLRRQLWLMVFGLFDVYVLLWFGDILFDYACYGMIMVVFRKLPVKKLFIAAFICFVLMMVRENRDFYQDKAVIRKGEKVLAMDTTQVKLNDQQKEDLAAYTDMKESSTRESKMKKVEKALRKTNGDYGHLYEYRTGVYNNFLVHYLYLGIWDVLLFMFLGMAFYRTGILTGQASNKLYAALAVLGLGLGLLVSYYRIRSNIHFQFNYFELARHDALETYTLSRTLRGLGIFGTLMLMYKSGWFRWFFALFRPVGQMAFTNYLTQSLLCGLFFYGIGLGYYGKLQRYEVYEVVLGIWVLQIIWSHLWLRYFNFGPLEWCWRSLTYWKKQPNRKQKGVTPE